MHAGSTAKARGWWHGFAGPWSYLLVSLVRSSWFPTRGPDTAAALQEPTIGLPVRGDVMILRRTTSRVVIRIRTLFVTVWEQLVLPTLCCWLASRADCRSIIATRFVGKKVGLVVWTGCCILTKTSLLSLEKRRRSVRAEFPRAWALQRLAIHFGQAVDLEVQGWGHVP